MIRDRRRSYQWLGKASLCPAIFFLPPPPLRSECEGNRGLRKRKKENGKLLTMSSQERKRKSRVDPSAQLEQVPQAQVSCNVGLAEMQHVLWIYGTLILSYVGWISVDIRRRMPDTFNETHLKCTSSACWEVFLFPPLSPILPRVTRNQKKEKRKKRKGPPAARRLLLLLPPPRAKLLRNVLVSQNLPRGNEKVDNSPSLAPFPSIPIFLLSIFLCRPPSPFSPIGPLYWETRNLKFDDRPLISLYFCRGKKLH